MQYTLRQACKAVASSLHSYGVTDPKSAINEAIQALSGLAGWDCMRKVVRILSESPVFALPQGCSGLVRACVNGKPTSIRGQDFMFLHSGPGDLRNAPHGYDLIPNANILDSGYFPTMVVPSSSCKLFVRSTDSAPVTVKGVLQGSNQIKTVVIEPTTDSVEDAETTDEVFSNILSVTIDECATEYSELYADYGTLRISLGSYHPDVKAPQFHLYTIQNARGPLDILAEVRIDPLPLVRDTDIIPFDSLEPIEYMIQARWLTKSGEIDAAQKFHALAGQWLKMRETVANTVQTPVIVNSLFSMSGGEISYSAENI